MLLGIVFGSLFGIAGVHAATAQGELVAAAERHLLFPTARLEPEPHPFKSTKAGGAVRAEHLAGTAYPNSSDSSTAAHLLITEIQTTPSSSEFVEIHNPPLRANIK